METSHGKVAEKMSKQIIGARVRVVNRRPEITTYAPRADCTRSRGFSWGGCEVLVTGERAGEVANECVAALAPSKRPMADVGCIRQVNGEVGLFNRVAGGLGERAIFYPDWRSLLLDWDIDVLPPQQDATGIYWPIRARGAL